MAEGPVNITAALRDMRANLVEVKQIRWQDILKHQGNVKLGKTDAQGNWYGASTSDEKEIARLKKDGYKVMKEEVTEECAKHDSLKLKKRNEEEVTESKVFNKDRGIFKALLSLSKKKEYKKVSKAFVNLTMPSPMAKDKEIAKGLSKRLKQLADKLGKKEKAHVLKMADLASTYER